MAQNADILRQLETEMKEFQKLETQMSDIHKQKKRLDTQKNENEMVLSELEFLGDDAVLYKMIGPALVKQTKSEVKNTVTARIGYVTNEMAGCDVRYQTLTKDRDAKREKIITLQNKFKSKPSQ